MKSSRDIQKTPSSDPWAMSSNLSSGVHRGDASDQSPVQENRPHGLRRRTSLWKIDKFITLLLHQKRFRECRVLLRRHGDISQEPLLNNYHQLQQWKYNPIKWNDQTLFSSSGPRCFWPGIESGTGQKFRDFGDEHDLQETKVRAKFQEKHPT